MTSAANCRIDSTTKACGTLPIFIHTRKCAAPVFCKVPQSRGGVVRIANHGVLATDGFVGYRQARTVLPRRAGNSTPRRVSQSIYPLRISAMILK